MDTQKNLILHNIVIISGLLLVLGGLIFGLTTQSTFKYASSAQEDSIQTYQTQTSISIVRVPSTELASCVQETSYLPSSSTSTCFVEVICKDITIIKKTDQCSQSETQLSCTYAEDTCLNIDDIHITAATMCGCSE